MWTTHSLKCPDDQDWLAVMSEAEQRKIRCALHKARWGEAGRQENWDIAQCPDGHEHEWCDLGYASAESGPLEGGPYMVSECHRCGVGSIDAPIENVAAAFQAKEATR